MNQRTYIAIDLKSFYASVECVERGLDPLATNLVVADKSRTDKTICLAVSPSLKAHGIGGRPRLFEVVQKVREVNSTRVYQVYLKYIAPEDIYPYSIDEVFIDATNYLPTYKITAHELALKMVRDVLKETGITATAGIGTNMYLCKIAMDIVAHHLMADQMVLTVVYDAENLTNPKYRSQYHGEITTDYYGRPVPKHAHGTRNLKAPTSSSKLMIDTITELFDQIVNPHLLVRRIYLTVNRVISEQQALSQPQQAEQLDLFTDYEAEEKKKLAELESSQKERKVQETLLKIKKKYGKNAILKGLNFEEGATAKERNQQIGGHKA